MLLSRAEDQQARKPKENSDATEHTTQEATQPEQLTSHHHQNQCVCVCVCERERKRLRQKVACKSVLFCRPRTHLDICVRLL